MICNGTESFELFRSVNRRKLLQKTSKIVRQYSNNTEVPTCAEQDTQFNPTVLHFPHPLQSL